MRRLLGPVGLLVVGGLALLGCTDDSEWDAPTMSAGSDPTADAGDGAVEEGLAQDASVEARLQRALDEVMDAYDVPGAVVAVDLPDGEQWRAAQGLADVDGDVAMTEDQVWPIRSITKSFTVTILLQLVDEGLVSLDDTIDEWVPDFPEGDRVTLGELADMTAGVPEYVGDAFVADFSEDPDATFTRDQLIDYARQGEPIAAPGEQAIYINTSTVLLGEVVKQVTGQPFEQLLAERITEPLGMTDTAYPTEPDGWTGEHATGYQPDPDADGEQTDVPNNFTVFDTAGAMTSTVDDLLIWAPALAEGELLEQPTQMARLVGQPLEEGPEYDQYASGIGEIDGWWGHTGEGFGVTALVMHEPDTGADVVIFMNLSNVDRHAPTVLMREIAAILAESAE